MVALLHLVTLLPLRVVAMAEHVYVHMHTYIYTYTHTHTRTHTHTHTHTGNPCIHVVSGNARKSVCLEFYLERCDCIGGKVPISCKYSASIDITDHNI